MQAIVIALGYPPELDGKTLLLKTHLDCRKQRNQARAGLKTPSLLSSLHTSRSFLCRLTEEKSYQWSYPDKSTINPTIRTCQEKCVCQCNLSMKAIRVIDLLRYRCGNGGPESWELPWRTVQQLGLKLVCQKTTRSTQSLVNQASVCPLPKPYVWTLVTSHSCQVTHTSPLFTKEKERKEIPI